MRINRRILTLVAVLGSTFFLSSCSNKNISGLGFPKGVSSVNNVTGPLWYWSWIAAGVVGVFTFILIMWPVVFHRKKNDEFPKQTRYNVPVEVAYTLIPLVIVAILFGYTLKDQQEITKLDTFATAPHNIHIKAMWIMDFGFQTS
jgi:cytochrome c oxidase subunit 2